MEWFKEWGAVDFGYTEDSLPDTVDKYNAWVTQGHHLPLSYLEGERQIKRQDLKNHWNDFQSALVFLFSYHPVQRQLQNFYRSEEKWNGLKIASYVLGFAGEDYHHQLRTKLEGIGERLKKEHGLDYRLTLDTHPVLERDLAKRAGLGWFGKNSMMINRQHGSFFIIGSLLLNQKLDLHKKKRDVDHCGQCTRCIEACPTQAIDPETRTIVAQDCISTFTIEQFKIDSQSSPKMNLREGTVFGCDICQDVCPWNKRADRHLPPETLLWSPTQNKILDFFMRRPVSELRQNLEEMSGGEFKRLFEKTALERSGKRGLLKNIWLYCKQMWNT